MVPAIEGRDVVEGGAIDVRGPFAGESIDFRAVLVGVPVLVEFPDETVEPSCLVGDLLGDYEGFSPCVLSICQRSRGLLPVSIPQPALQQAWGSQHSCSALYLP